MKNYFSLYYFVLAIIIHPYTFAHGENHPGPHGGVIRMPGAFHTEVMPRNNGFEIMLLDINFQHPTTKNSSVKAAIKTDKKSIALKCEIRSNYFLCTANKHLIKKANVLHIVAMRENARGAEVSCALPLNRS